MPTDPREDGFRFFFYSDEGDPREPPHVHVRKDGIEAKFWLKPRVQCARNDGFDPRTLNRLQHAVERRQSEFVGKWHEHFT